jgi:hypothetical protein
VSLLFNGTTDKVTGTNVTYGNALTYVAWIRPSALGGGSLGRIVTISSERTSLGLIATAKLQFLSAMRTTTGVWRTTGDDLAFNSWQSVGASYDGTSVATNPLLYVNGVSRPVTVITAPVGAATGDGNAVIVGNRFSSAQGFAGEIGEFAMWFRQLTADEHMMVHRYGPLAALSIPEIYQKMSGSVASAFDFSGHGRHGTLTGTTLSSDPPVGFVPSVYHVIFDPTPPPPPAGAFGSSNIVLDPVTLVATGTLGAIITGALNQTLGAVTMVGAGGTGPTSIGTANIALDPVTLVASGSIFAVPPEPEGTAERVTRAYRRYSTQTIDRLIPGPLGFESFQKDDAATLGPLLAWGLLGSSAFSVSGRIAVGGAALNNLARAEVELWNPDHWASISVESDAPLGIGVALCCHSSIELTAYVAFQENLRWTIGRFTNGVFAAIAVSAYATDSPPPVRQGDVIRFSKRGSRFAVWHLTPDGIDRLALTGTEAVAPLTYTRAGIFARPSAKIGQFYCGVGDSSGPWGGGVISVPSVTTSTRDPYFGVLEPDEVSLSIVNEGWTPDQVLNLRGRPISVESWDVLDVEPLWRAHFYGGTALAGAPLLVQEYPAVRFSWPGGSPDPAVPTTNWSARFWSLARFHRATTSFRIESDDGARLYVDGVLVVDGWTNGLHVTTGSIALEAGWHTLELQFYQSSGAASLALIWSPTWSRRLESFTGVVTNPASNESVITLRCASLNPADLETQIPKGTIKAEDFPLAVDIGKTPAVPCGLAPRVPMLYVHRDLEASVYRYVCRSGIAEIVNVYRGWQEKNLFFVPPAEYTVSNTVYPGYTTLIFPEQQVDVSGGDVAIYADLSFPDAVERNPIRVLRRILNNPVWGLGKPYNAASFAAAEAAVTAYGGLWADGFMQDPRAARDYLRQLMMYRGIRLWVDAVGEYQVSVDTGNDTIVATLQDGLGEGVHNILSMSDVEGTPLLDMVKKYILKYRRNSLKGDFLGTHSRDALPREGQEWTEENIFVDANETADRVLDFLAKTHVSGDKRVSVTTGPEAHIVQARDLVSLTHRVGFADARMRVVRASKTTQTELALRGTALLDYVYTPGTLPTDGADHSFTDFSRVVPANPSPPTIFGSGIEAGVDDSMVAYHILEFTTPTGTTPPDQAYYSARIDVKRDGEPFYHTGYASDIGTGLRHVKISGLLPGVGYTHLVVPLTKFMVPGSGVSVSALTAGELVTPSQVTVPFISGFGTEFNNDGTLVGYHILRFSTPSGTSLADQIYSHARIDLRQPSVSLVWHTGYATTDDKGAGVEVKITNLVIGATYDYGIVSMSRLQVASARVVLPGQVAAGNKVTPSQITTPILLTGGLNPVATDGKFTSYHILRFQAPSAVSQERGDVAYARCRIDFREASESTFHKGYAEVAGKGQQDVKVSGLLPGRSYRYEFVSISTLNEPSAAVPLGPLLAPGDEVAPNPPTTPVLLSQHLREFMFGVTCGTDADLKELEWEVHTAAGGGGTRIGAGTGAAIRGAQATIKYTLPATVGYNSARFVRARLKDNTGNPSAFSAALSFSATRTVTDDYGPFSINANAIIDRAVIRVKRELLTNTSFSAVYGLDPGEADGGPYVHSFGEIPSWFIDTGNAHVIAFVSNVSSADMFIVAYNTDPGAAQGGVFRMYLR